MSRRRRRELTDLSEYSGCGADATIGVEPLAVGWLRRGREYEKGSVPAGFLPRLLAFCYESNTVCHTGAHQPCPFCNKRIPPVANAGQTVTFGQSEIRVLGDLEIYAAPTLVYHYVAEHGYRPPDEFVVAVMKGVPAGSTVHRALVNSY